jgi:hypothetical protein
MTDEYNTTPNATAERRYGEKDVILRHGEQVLTGSQFAYYPVDEPPVIAVPSLFIKWYRSTWERRGWKVEDAS